MGGLLIPQRKNIEANEYNDDDLYFDEQRSTRDFIAELRAKAESRHDAAAAEAAKNQKEKDKIRKMLREQRVRESIRNSRRMYPWDEDEKINKLREKFRNR